MNELASKKGDCASAILSVADDLGFEKTEPSLLNPDFSCHTEGALAIIADKPTFDWTLAKV
jgi:hypothetical protein